MDNKKGRNPTPCSEGRILPSFGKHRLKKINKKVEEEEKRAKQNKAGPREVSTSETR